MRKLTTLILMSSGVTAAFAAGTSGGPTFPNFVTADSNNIAYVYFQGARTGTPPTCAANIGGTFFRYAIDLTTPGGRAQLSVLLAANTSGANVWFAGTGTCTVDATTELLSYAQTNP